MTAKRRRSTHRERPTCDELRAVLREDPAPGAMSRSAYAWALTRREREVLARVVEGDTNRAIAIALDIAERTVATHLSSMFEKAAVESRAELVAKAFGSSGADGHDQPTDEHVERCACMEAWRLTPRETELLGLLVVGRSNRAISEALGIAERTVETHLTSMFVKAGVESRACLVAKWRDLHDARVAERRE